MAKKRETQQMSLSPASECIRSLVKQDDVKAKIVSAQDYLQQLENAPKVEQQQADIDKTLNFLEEQPLSKLQFTRVIQQLENGSAAASYTQLQDILSPLIQMTTESRLLIDPYCKSENDYSSRVNHYKKWLFDVLFIFFGYFPKHLHTRSDVLKDYLSFINRIHQGVTTSRVTLRQAANLNAEAIVELARNTPLQVFSRLVNTHWVKVIYSAEQGQIEGYVQTVYLKMEHGY